MFAELIFDIILLCHLGRVLSSKVLALNVITYTFC